jgi:uncharacterized protein YlxW (UPF0749 family)
MSKKFINTVYCAFVVVIIFIILVFKYSFKVYKVKKREEIRREVLHGIQQEIERLQQLQQQQNQRVIEIEDLPPAYSTVCQRY